MTFRIRALAVCGAVALVTGCGGQEAAPPAPASAAPAAPTVVAASTWEAAFAQAAGAEDVTVIVPASVVHAADYDPKPSDLAAVGSADLVLFAEFEGFAGRLKEAAGGEGNLMQLNLDNSPDNVRAEVRRLAERLGTTAVAEEWLTRYDATLTQTSDDIKAAWRDGQPPKVVSQAFVTYAANLAGARVVGTYGPAPVTPGQLAELTATAPDLVLDNVHMSTGEVMPGTGARQVPIVNYPGDDHDLLGVYRTNADQIITALRS